MKTKLLLFALLLITVSNLKAQFLCNANFTYTANPNGTVTFVGATNTSATSYYWNFGNGTSGFGQTATSIYNGPGPYSVCLTVIDSSVVPICQNSWCDSIVLGTTSGCQASYIFFPDSTSSVPFTFQFVSTSTGTGPFTYSWSWGDGTPNGTTMDPVHSFPSAGPYNVCLTITSPSPNSCTDNICQTVTGAIGSSCNAGFYLYPDSSAAHTYIGVNTSTSNSPAMSYTWYWGDGTSSTGQYPTHTYANSGTYNICLVVATSTCIDSFCYSQFLNKTEAAVTVNFQAPTGLNTISKTAAQLYPNPADDKLFIKGDKNNLYQIEIYNVNGSKVLSSSAKGNEAVNISSLPINLYMVKVTDVNGKTEYAKFTKQ